MDRGEALRALEGGHLPELAGETRVLDREAQRRLHAGHDDAEAPAGAPRDGLLRDDREDAQHVGVFDAALNRRLLAELAHLRLGRVGRRLLDCDISQGPRHRRAHPAEAAAPELLREDEPRARDLGRVHGRGRFPLTSLSLILQAPPHPTLHAHRGVTALLRCYLLVLCRLCAFVHGGQKALRRP